MRILALSDLHLEFWPFEPLPVTADLVVLAGDIHVGKRGVEWAKRAFPETPVIMVPGNHEFYGYRTDLVDELRAAAAGSHVHVLENEEITLNGIRFLGGTLWTDFRLLGNANLAAAAAALELTDFKKIRVGPSYRRFQPRDAAALHAKTHKWLETKFTETEPKTVVVTHHAPSRRSLPPQFQDDLLSAAFASNLDEFVERSNALLWIHGHLHSSSDYMLGSTRVLCNPRGYPDETNDEFSASLVIDV